VTSRPAARAFAITTLVLRTVDGGVWYEERYFSFVSSRDGSSSRLEEISP
jgi:hypothetical protein